MSTNRHLKGSMKELNKFHNYETEKITCKTSDTAEYIELFGSSTRDRHRNLKKSDGWKKEIYQDVRFFHGALHLTSQGFCNGLFLTIYQITICLFYRGDSQAVNE